MHLHYIISLKKKEEKVKKAETKEKFKTIRKKEGDLRKTQVKCLRAKW